MVFLPFSHGFPRFIIAPKTVGYSGGVGDDDYGWAVDGQHALRSLDLGKDRLGTPS